MGLDEQIGAASSARRAGSPRLTVLIPAWNAASTIERSLASVLEDTGIDLECVVIDDGSSDQTASLVQAMAVDDPRVILLHLETNGGVSEARNRGLAVARGEWLAFHDADDRMLPGGIAALMRATADPTVRAVIGQRVWTDGTRTWLGPWYDIPDIRQPGRKSIAANPGLLYYASATGKLFHHSLVDGLPFHGRLLGDQAWTIRALLRAGHDIEVIDTTVFEWWRPSSDEPATGITATSRASGRGAGEVATMAASVFGAVSDEIDTLIADEPTRLAIKQAYFDRLIRADLAGQVHRVLARRDPDTAAFFDAVARFLRAVPAPVRAASDMLMPLVLRPPARQWRYLTPPARDAFGSMLAPVAKARPGAAVQVRVYRATATAAARSGPFGRAAVGTARWLARVGRSVRRHRRGRAGPARDTPHPTAADRH